MSFYYPQAAMILTVSWEDFKATSEAKTAQTSTFPVLAKKVTVNINDYNSADTFSAELDYRDFPFDPRCIRSLLVAIHMQDMKSLTEDGVNPSKIEATPSNVVFQGFADEESIRFNDNAMTVSFEGRDYTALLLDAKYPGATIDMAASLGGVISLLLSTLKATENLKVVNRSDVNPLPTIGKFASDYSPLAQKKNVKRQESYWEVIQDLVGRAGLIAFVEIDKLVIASPRTVFKRTTGYEFIYGKNLKSLEFKRKLGRTKGVNISVRSLGFEKKEVLEAKIPEEATESWCTAMGIKKERVKVEKMDTKGKIETTDAPFLGFRVKDISSKEALVKIGEGVFEEIGRQQIEGAIETREMISLQGNNQTPIEYNITKIRCGTPVRIEIDVEDLKELSKVARTPVRAAYLRRKGYVPKIADALAQSLGNFDTIFYTKAVTFTIDQEGFTMKLDFVNFIEVEGRVR
jgi:hypothetical protein